MTIKRSFLPALIIAALSLSGAGLAVPALAQQADPQDETPQQDPFEQPATFAADEMTRDEKRSTITASGNVEVNQAGRTLLADTITYNQKSDTIEASGNVTLHLLSGEILFANQMEITGDLKSGMIADLLAVLKDSSRFAAKSATLGDNETLTMKRALYSACSQCKNDPSKPLMWQLKAVKIVRDGAEKMVTYTDVWLEMFGIPVAYTPYLSYPDPTVKRKSGLLTPRWGSSTDLGVVVQAPYFYTLGESADVTLTPIVMSKEYGAVAGEYRERFTNGRLDVDASVAYDSASRAYGHIKSKARFDIDETWRWGADINRSSSDTYLRRYGLGGEQTLTSQAFIEGFRANSYTSVSAMSYQDLRANADNSTSPVILPVIQFNYQGTPDQFGAYNSFDLNLTKLSREQGVDSTRLSLRPSWNVSYIAPKGDQYKLRATMGLDFFNAQSLSVPDNRGGVYNGSALRVSPEVEFDWSWPLARRSTNVTETLEPIAQVIVSPYGGNSYKMANEDSRDFDFNDTNLFSANRFTGYDRVESGPRANYGLKWGVVGDGGGNTSVMLGQSYRLKADSTFQKGSGLEDNFSDYIARLKVSPGESLDLLYRTRIDKDSLDFRRNEVGLRGSYSTFTYKSDYVFFDRQEGSEFSGRKELSYAFANQFSEFWRGKFSGVRDMSNDGGQLSSSLGLVYENECLLFDTTLSRTYYRDRELRPTDAIMFRLVFKTLGEVRSGISASN